MYKRQVCEVENQKYFYVADGAYERTVEAGDRVLLDLDADGNVLGVELLTKVVPDATP